MDLNPSAHYHAWGMMKGMCSHSRFYSYELEQVIHPKHHLQVLGYPLEAMKLDSAQDCDVRDLAGHAHALQQATLVMNALLLGLKLPDVWQADVGVHGM